MKKILVIIVALIAFNILGRGSSEKSTEHKNTQAEEAIAEQEEKEEPEERTNTKLAYDDDGYIIVTYSTRGELESIDKPNVHLRGTLIDTNNMIFTIEDEEGGIWTGQSAGGRDFREYIGTECDIYGFCTGGISSVHDTPLVDMAYNDSHISFEDGRSYYPKDHESYSQFPSWPFENERESSEMSVWIPTDGGTKYHSYSGCSGMENPEQVTEAEAIERGFDRCGKCW